MNYKKEFRNFDFDIPHTEGFIDNSWHNDVSPKFERKYNETHSVVFWVDYFGCLFIWIKNIFGS